ncbi:dynein regulatory complex subunit 5 [Gymnodraco acuticeps]|uniref:Dynein regulatory complex subunit 5 n=1 Tax=Gymnodraco acuticeps TaxID=8218 RepID=A0A6P8WFG0_GYMAC|nr:dynein regulatory complex subunit 5 [Gymnodraco acuticeps]XP_034096036.1 dynein regulatory complex subunit 5 [Gymnodraco acuticeps]
MSRSPDPPEAADPRQLRRIIAEDAHWFLNTVPSLSNLCLQSIVNHFEERPIWENLSPVHKDFVQERLSTSMPLHVTANLIHDGVYWKRCCEKWGGIRDLTHYGNSWKRMFFEKHMENMIELFIPDVTEPKTFVEMVPLCKDYIKRLNISQLLPPVTEPQKEEEEYGSELVIENEDGPSMDHFDFNIMLDKLTNLEEFHVVYRVKQCGLNFECKMFEMTHRDCESLAKAVKSCKTLKILRLNLSHMEDTKCRLLVKYLLDHPSLRELDLSHNLIGDKGARAIGKLLNRSSLETLNLCDNNIGGPGAKALAHALSMNSTLLSLNLRLNRLRDEGGQAIGKALLNNNTLLLLHLGANEVTWPSAIALSKVLVQRSTLKSLNLSCNNLGVDGGKALEEAMSNNSSLTECDIRLTEVEEQSASFVNQVVWTNQSLEQRRHARESKTKKTSTAVY